MGPPAFGPLVGWIGAEQYGRVRVPQIERYPFRAYAHAPLAWFHAAAARAHRDPGSDRPVRHRRARLAPAGTRRVDVHSRSAMPTCARSRASKSTKKAVLPDGGQMYAVTMVSGGSWSLVLQRPTRTRATPGTGSATSTAVAPRSATACRTSTRPPRCSRRPRSQEVREMRRRVAARRARARRRPRRQRSPKGPSVLAVSRVTGGSWSTDCAGDSDRARRGTGSATSPARASRPATA